MLIILGIFYVLYSIGLYLSLCDCFGVPSLRAEQAAIRVRSQARKNERNRDLILIKIATRLSVLIKLDDYQKRKLTASLQSAELAFSPEVYLALAWVKAGMVFIFIIPCLILFPIASPVILFVTITVYFKERGSADELLKRKKEQIDYELPRFAATLTQELKTSRDVLSILENYKKNAGDSLKRELEITIADMKSGNYEGALTRFETRVNSVSLSDITRGLIGVLRGDDGVTYFQMLSHDLKQLELQRLKAYAVRQPEKIKKYSFLMLACFVAMYIVVLALQLFSAVGSLNY